MSFDTGINLFLCGIGLLCLTVIFMPILMYLISGLTLRRREILSSFNESAISTYFKTFYPNEYSACLIVENETSKKSTTTRQKKTSAKLSKPALDSDKLNGAFKNYCSKCFGRRQYIFPGLLLLIIAVFFIVISALMLRPHIRLLFGFSGFISDKWYYYGAIAGFAGGYMWLANFLITRMQERRLNPSDLCWGAMRLLLSVPIVLTIAFFSKAPFQSMHCLQYVLC